MISFLFYHAKVCLMKNGVGFTKVSYAIFFFGMVLLFPFFSSAATASGDIMAAWGRLKGDICLFSVHLQRLLKKTLTCSR